MIGSIVFYALVGICPDWWPWPKFPIPGPPPPPWWTTAIIGMVGGIAGGLLVQEVLAMNDNMLVGNSLIAAGVGAFAVSKLALVATANMRGAKQ